MSAADIAQALAGGRAINHGGGWWGAPCPVLTHGKGKGDRRFSLSLKEGDRVTLIAVCHGGCAFEDIAAELRRMGLSNTVRRPPPVASADAHDGADRTAWALALWSEASGIVGTLAERYLRRRGLMLPPDGLRYHMRCPFGRGERHPCMVGLFRSIETNAPVAVHRTALAADGRKIDRKALGPSGGGAMKLWPDDSVTVALAIGEGIETTIAGAMRGFAPAWALGSAGAIERFPVLAGIESLTILVDHDERGRAAAATCSRRWTRAGREVFRVLPLAPGGDMADLVAEGAA